VYGPYRPVAVTLPSTTPDGMNPFGKCVPAVNLEMSRVTVGVVPGSVP
jgi:hypothetical protein